MALSLTTSIPYPNVPFLNGNTVSDIWYRFIQRIATEARVSDTDGSLSITGDADDVQFTVNAYTTQTERIVEVYDSAGILIFSLDNSGNLYTAGNLTIPGTVDGRNISADGSLLDTVSSGVDGSVKGRAVSTGTGTVVDLTPTEIRVIINVEDGADVTDETNVKASLDGATITDVGTVAGGDVVLLQDISDSNNLKTATAQSIADLASGSGKVQQVVYSSTATAGSTATGIPVDNSIPQNTEGAELLTTDITPGDANNILVIEGIIPYASISVGAAYISTAIFQDTTADALQASATWIPGASTSAALLITHIMLAGTTSSTTFKLRYGPSANTAYVLQTPAGTDVFSTSCIAFLKITEISP